ncbi:MAG: FkbM family methyltransferase [Parachlamydiales bacterium]|jgi:FkbM family methyltransferase
MNFIKKSLKNLSNIKAINNIDHIKDLLKENICLVDVGSTGGVEEHFKEIEEILHVITFDPDPRAETIKTKGKFENFNIGLWSSKDVKKLYLKRYPQASTFYDLNEKLLFGFLNSFCHENVGEENFEVNSLENILLSKNIYPDFIKVDAEGSDLEILKGSEKFLSNSCLGVQAEVSFADRHLNAPYFSDIDQYLRKFGYVLMNLESEKWIRKNNVFSPTSNPQIIWGNAVYVLSINEFSRRLSILDEEKRQQIIIKFITLLLIFKFHDYAYEVSEYLNENKFLSKAFYLKITRLISLSLPSRMKCYLKSLSGILISILLMMIFSVFPNKRAKSVNFFKEKIRFFAKILLNTRYGPNNTCV